MAEGEDAYETYVEGRREREARAVPEWAVPTAGPVEPRPWPGPGQPERRGMHWGWWLYWAAWAAVAAAALVALLQGTEEGDDADWTTGTAFGVWVFGALPLVAFVALGGMFVILELLTPAPTYNGEPTSPWARPRTNSCASRTSSCASSPNRGSSRRVAEYVVGRRVTRYETAVVEAGSREEAVELARRQGGFGGAFEEAEYDVPTRPRRRSWSFSQTRSGQGMSFAGMASTSTTVLRVPVTHPRASPPDGLEPSTSSLPCAPIGNWWQPVATVLACFCRFRSVLICHGLPLVAPARLHKRSIRGRL
jgi:hypothetical protein